MSRECELKNEQAIEANIEIAAISEDRRLRECELVRLKEAVAKFNRECEDKTEQVRRLETDVSRPAL